MVAPSVAGFAVRECSWDASNGGLRDDATIYEAAARQIHSLAYHLEHRKFAHLRRAYAWFLGGFLAAGVAQLITLAVR
jgi:hypothetical protein